MGYETRPTIILYDLGSNAIDKFRKLFERKIETGTVTGSGTETTGTYAGYFYIEDTSKNWSDDIWKYCIVEIVDGTGVGTVAKVIGNSATRLYLDRTITVDTTSKYAISIEVAREATLEGVKAQTDKLTFDANNNLLIGINADNVGLATETTLAGIKTQTDKLTFDANNYLYVNIGTSSIQVPVDVQNVTAQLYNQLLNADLTVAQSITLDTKGFKLLEVYASSTAATNFYLDVSNDNVNWFTYYTWSSATEVKEAYWNGWRYVRLRSDAAGTTGDVVTLIICAKP